MKIDTAENTTGTWKTDKLIEQNNVPNAHKFKGLEKRNRCGGQKPRMGHAFTYYKWRRIHSNLNLTIFDTKESEFQRLHYI